VSILVLLRIARWLNTQTSDTKDLNLMVMQRLTQCTKVHRSGARRKLQKCMYESGICHSASCHVLHHSQPNNTLTEWTISPDLATACQQFYVPSRQHFRNILLLNVRNGSRFMWTQNGHVK